MNGYTRNIAIVLAAALTLAGVFATTVLTARADTPQDTSTEASGASLSDATLAGGEDIAEDAVNSTESDEAAPLVESETLPQENPYGLAALWAQGDLVAKGTLMILAIMSVGSWYILFTKLLEQRSFLAYGRAAHKRVAQGSSIEALSIGLNGLNSGPSMASDRNCKGDWRSSQPSGPRRHSSVYSEPFGAFTTRLLPSVLPVRRHSTKWQDPSVRPSS